MRRLLAIAVLLAAVGVVAVLGTGADNGDDGKYQVRAIFNNAFSVIPGEDVKIAGVKVGSIDSLDVTKDNKAAVVLNIDEPGFKDFRKDATCTIRPQSLIGEKFVECTPTVPRAEGQPEAPPLDQIKEGDGKGQYLLPSTNTLKPVDIDLLNNIMRLPYRERFTIILNELGTGLAANGGNLREAIRAANPALEQTDKVLKILAEQNRVLADLARHGDEVLRPLARDRNHVADFIVQANTTARASAERRVDIERNIQKFPPFLRQLTPTMRDLGELSDQITPVMESLEPNATQLSRFIEGLGPLSTAATPALQSLGDASVTGRQALVAAKPVVGDLQDFATNAKPLVTNLAKLLTSFQSTGGIEKLMDTLFFQTTSINGFDSFGHYLRAVLVVNTCSTYRTTPQDGCSSKFQHGTAASAASHQAASAQSVQQEIDNGRSPFLARQDGVLNGLDPTAVLTGTRSGQSNAGSNAGSATGSAPPAGQRGSKAPAPAAPSSAPKADDPTSTLLDYLLGN